jgi:hypothetical protein
VCVCVCEKIQDVRVRAHLFLPPLPPSSLRVCDFGARSEASLCVCVCVFLVIQKRLVQVFFFMSSHSLVQLEETSLLSNSNTVDIFIGEYVHVPRQCFLFLRIK